MVMKPKSGTKKSKVKVGKLKVNKETVQDLTDSDAKKVKGGFDPLGGQVGYVTQDGCGAKFSNKAGICYTQQAGGCSTLNDSPSCGQRC